VLDEDRDRMVVFGGGGSDTWALPLSGPGALRWTKLVAAGEHPPVPGGSDGTFLTGTTGSAIYDPFGKRMIVLVEDPLAPESQRAEAPLWELSLDDAPTWRRLVPAAGPAPGVEVTGGKLTLDRAGRRAIVVGGTLGGAGVWALSLDGGAPTWSRVADPPPEGLSVFFGGALQALDEKRGQLIVFGLLGRVWRVWALSLASATWSVLDEGNQATASYGAAVAVDAAGDRLIVFGGDQNAGAAAFSLATHDWTAGGSGDFGEHFGCSGVADPKRGRLLCFSGSRAYVVTNRTWALAFDTLRLSELVPATRTVLDERDNQQAVWDPVRGAVVSFGNYQTEGGTFIHGLAPGDAWMPLAAGASPRVSFTPAVYDTHEQAIVAFGGYQYDEVRDVVRLPSTPGAAWQRVPVADGPAERSEHLAVYDPARRRLLIRGGHRRVAGQLDPELFDDVWALSLDAGAGAAPTWTPISAAGASPGPLLDEAGIYDPVDDRLIVFGGTEWTSGLAHADLHSLRLGDAPTWAPLAAAGAGPDGARTAGYRGARVAVYDAARHRMILVDLAASGSKVFALELGATTPVWHRFCVMGPAPARGASDVVLVPDGLFVSASGGAFRFNLETPYCD
jgi:hypothetical protein